MSTVKILAVIPARGGSKRIPDKNIYPLWGKPLLLYSLETLHEINVIDRVIVSTDSERIADIARSGGAEVMLRPDEIASDTASTESVLIQVLDTLAHSNEYPEYILTVPPTSPLRTVRTIRKFVAEYLAVCDKYDSMITLTETRGDFWQKNDDGEYHRLFPDAPRRRQDRKPLFEENSALYITRTEALISTGSVLGSRTAGFVIDPIEAVDINEPIDLEWAEFLLQRRSR
jgi:CMP-N-acetylneuraminic acid synthetase